MVIFSHFRPANRPTERKHSIALFISVFLLVVISATISKQEQQLTPYELGHAVGVGQILKQLFGDLWLFYLICKVISQLKS
ncbi:MAG: hypothetical protein H6Q17_2726 [Bacteroidetes bacterium]|nr:hypothetical protein [Bacteroidota bacterium]